VPSVTFHREGGDSKYLHGRKSMSFFAGNVKNGVQLECPGICLAPRIPDPNGCRVKWNPDPYSVYKVSLDYNPTADGAAWVVDADWASLPSIIDNDIIPDVSPIFSVTTDGSNMTWSPIDTLTTGPFLYSPIAEGALTREPPINFLNFTGDPESNCTDATDMPYTEIVVAEIRGELPTLPADAVVPYFSIKEALPESISVDGRSALRWGEAQRPPVQYVINEVYRAGISNTWSNGVIGTNWYVTVESRIVERTRVTATLVWVSGPPSAKVVELRYGFETTVFDVENTPTIAATQSGVLSDAPGNDSLTYTSFPDVYETPLTYVTPSTSYAFHYDTPPASDPAGALRRPPYWYTGGLQIVNLDNFATVPNVNAKWWL